MMPDETSSRGLTVQAGMEPIVKSSKVTSLLFTADISFPTLSCHTRAVESEQPAINGLSSFKRERKISVPFFICLASFLCK